MMKEKYIKIAIFLALTAVALGALAAHALQDLLSISEIRSFETGVRYQLIHAITLLILSLNSDKFNHNLKNSLKIMTAGTCLFSFSIYLLCFQDILALSISHLGLITPIGGLLLIFSWIILLFCIKK